MRFLFDTFAILQGMQLAHVLLPFLYIPEARPNPFGPGIENIDFIYMINLDQRPENYKMRMDLLEPYGIIFRYSILNDWEITSDEGHLIPVMEKGQYGTCHLNDNIREQYQEVPQKNGKIYLFDCISREAICRCMGYAWRPNFKPAKSAMVCFP